ncbi:Phosphate-specific transport system accessory protein PhoU [Sphingomonas antarctica]|uniref:phosphate signaling complex protein PhoU n=1 Tax=Sphingomonas antarctica TaxID=2040274 RepID=UPI0039EAAA3E
MATQIRNEPPSIGGEIGELRVLIAEMGGRAERAIAGSVAALTRGDEVGAAAIVAEDAAIDSMAAKVERLAVAIIGQGVLAERDLRDVVAALKMAGVVERIGDYAKNIAKRVPQIRNDRKIEAVSVLPAMAEAAMAMVRDALDSFAARDPVKAAAVTRRDRQVDDFYDSIFRALVTHMMENPPTIGAAAQLLFVAKNLERIGDQATNIAEMVYFAATGEQLAERERGAGEIG